MQGSPATVFGTHAPAVPRTPKPSAPKPTAPKPAWVHVYPAFVDSAIRRGEVSGGFHNRNYLAPLTEPMARAVGRPAGETVTVRLREREALSVVIRTWEDETQILDALRGVLPDVPRCLAKAGSSTVLSYVEGVPLSSICQNGKPVDHLLVEALVDQLAQMARIGQSKLPRLPTGWPRDRQSRAFLRHLALLTDRHVRRPNWAEFGGLFAALGIPADSMAGFAGRVPPMVPRPFGLLHTDLHRDNVIVSYVAAPPLIFVDWELATLGDPLHDLATHLVRMQYPPSQQDEVKQVWARAMEARRPEAARGLETDLRHYLDFERAQSVFPDVMRAARSLGAAGAPADLREAAEAVVRAMEAAREPLRLSGVPDVVGAAQILRRWHMARMEQAGQRTRGPFAGVVTAWVNAEEFPDEDAARETVADTLVAEGAAYSERVFKGTGHLNTVVDVRGRRLVVRRRLRSAARREQCFNDESEVLRAVARVGAVRAPRLLALGESAPSDAFAVLTYSGTFGGSPSHPVDGLSPYEADDLVDQLAALTEVDVDGMEPRLPPGAFYRWLCDQLVELVASLPPESLRLARELGLPDAALLRGLLLRRSVTPRAPVLLHGDLNPWNLVRGPQLGQLEVIDWEMAVAGDPLYDLVRHLHLTPHQGEIRQRMLNRWADALRKRSPEYAAGWAGDVHTYRWIELVRSAYVDLDRLVTGASLDAPNVRRAVNAYSMTLRAATEALGLGHARVQNPYLALVLTRGEHDGPRIGGRGATC
ncbi:MULTISPECIES: aminoglycoside phosphotransferase family protein [Streptomyces]|uniref:Aminoglycoside phosphotransferase family protein n=1 Tax=Streptomyces cremeus TaxID=66881 RepID=A0ABV5P9A3_STRCM